MAELEEDLAEKRICYKCIEDPFLKKEIRENGERIKCSYCQRKAIGYTFPKFADRVSEAFLIHFERTATDQSDYDYYKQLANEDSSQFWYREGEEVISILQDPIGFTEELAIDLAKYLQETNYDHEAAEMSEESEFSSEAMYETKGFSDEKWQQEWENFENILKSQSRYFNEEVNDYLSRVFKNIEKVQTYDRSPLITTAGPDTSIPYLYRARAFQSHERLMESLSYPDQHLGPPPSEFASAGRMNARGIPVFYGATHQKVALAEVRPPVGSNVAVAKFDIIREIRLLNLPAFGKIRSHFQGSIFDDGYVPDLEQAVFLSNLGQRMILPVMPDHEVFEYLPTQVIADYLSSRTDLNCDGIIFPSIQVPGESLNVVLFNKAAKVEAILLEKGSTVTAESDVTGYEEANEIPDINVIETRIDITNKEIAEPNFAEMIENFRREQQMGSRYDNRQVTLKIDTDSIIVNIVKGVDFALIPREVNRITLIQADENIQNGKVDLDF